MIFKGDKNFNLYDESVENRQKVNEVMQVYCRIFNKFSNAIPRIPLSSKNLVPEFKAAGLIVSEKEALEIQDYATNIYPEAYPPFELPPDHETTFGQFLTDNTR